MVGNKFLAKALRTLETCVLVNYNLQEKLVSLLALSITFDERFKVALKQFFISDFDLLSCELDYFTFKVLHWAILYWYYIKTK